MNPVYSGSKPAFPGLTIKAEPVSAFLLAEEATVLPNGDSNPVLLSMVAQQVFKSPEKCIRGLVQSRIRIGALLAGRGA